MSENKRKPVSRKTRFEVFKRDSFTCQYCGQKAPTVTLHLDHIHPLAKGGDNNILNLVTSCAGCNLGKSDRTLQDDSVLQKQHNQLKELNERREQMKMMLEWREELKEIEQELVQVLVSFIESELGLTVTEAGYKTVTRWLRKYDYDTLLDATETAAYQYEDNQIAFDKIPRIAHYIINPLPDWKKEVYYIRGILRNRLHYINEYKVLTAMFDAYNAGVEVEEIRDAAIYCKNYTGFMSIMSDLAQQAGE